MDKWELKTRYTREIHTKKFKCAKKGTVIRTIHSTYIQGVSKLMGGPFPIKQLPMILLSIKSKCYNSNNTRPNQEVGIPSLVGGSWPGREKPHLTKTRGVKPPNYPLSAPMVVACISLVYRVFSSHLSINSCTSTLHRYSIPLLIKKPTLVPGFYDLSCKWAFPPSSQDYTPPWL